jgi:hypothetical protein
MSEPPRLRCPQCGQVVTQNPGGACPECGFWIDAARIRHEGAVRFWRFGRFHRRMDIVLGLLWIVALGLGYAVISVSPGSSLIVVTCLSALTVVGFGYYLRDRRAKRR